jgi:hypothetical protein
MSKEYNALDHSVVQALLKPDATQRYEADAFIEALLRGIVHELERVYWNWNQEQLNNREDWEFLEIPGFEYRRYCWTDDPGECARPNMKFGAVIIDWYKYLGRGMSVNVDWSALQWKSWFNDVLKALSMYDVCIQHRHHAWRDEDAGLEAFSSYPRVQCSACKYCVAFGANSLIWNRAGSVDVNDAEDD